jgi:ferredoxin
MRVEFDRRGCTGPEACRDRLLCTAAWDRFERGDGVGRAVLRGIDDCSSPHVGLRVPEAEEDAAREAARVCPAGAITIGAEERYDPWVGSSRR